MVDITKTRCSRRPGRLRYLGLLCFALVMGGPASAQSWAPNEALVSPQIDLLDPEYNQARGQFIWGDIDGKLWIGNIDRATGMFIPPDGKAVLVDPSASGKKDSTKTGNGPEWAYSNDGDRIVYTKFDGSHSIAHARIGMARALPDGTWSAGFLDQSLPRRSPYGSETLGDAAPRITYVDENNFHYWRELDDPSTEQALTGTQQNTTGVRSVRGARAVIYIGAAGKTNQVFYRNLDSGAVEQLTFDSGNKNGVFMWQAPEYGGEYLFMLFANNGKELRVYRKLAPNGGGTPAWTPIYTAAAPTGASITSPEPFTYNGRSYIFFAVTVPKTDFSSEIWISNIDAAAPLFRRITDNTVMRNRGDPEVFITDRGPRIYYNRRQVAVGPKGNLSFCSALECSEGIYMADPGL